MRTFIRSWIIVLFLGAIITSCDFGSQPKTQKTNKGSDWFVSKSGDSILRKFRENGKLKSYSTRVNGVRNGISKKPQRAHGEFQKIPLGGLMG
ncbi:MAG: hypothetical protein GXO89_13095 [Chlorobi bacterium]|nr:hypothetical protein [Chlorobiota bacterium]